MQEITVENLIINDDAERRLSGDVKMGPETPFKPCRRIDCPFANYCVSHTGDLVARIRNLPKFEGMWADQFEKIPCGVNPFVINEIHLHFTPPVFAKSFRSTIPSVLYPV